MNNFLCFQAVRARHFTCMEREVSFPFKKFPHCRITKEFSFLRLIAPLNFHLARPAGYAFPPRDIVFIKSSLVCSKNIIVVMFVSKNNTGTRSAYFIDQREMENSFSVRHPNIYSLRI